MTPPNLGAAIGVPPTTAYWWLSRNTLQISPTDRPDFLGK